MSNQIESFNTEILHFQQMLHKSMELIRKFMDNSQFYDNIMSKKFLAPYGNNAFEKPKPFMQKIREKEDSIKEVITALQEKEQSIASTIESIKASGIQSFDELTSLIEQQEIIERAIRQQQKIANQTISNDMFKATSEKHLTDYEILHATYYYEGDDSPKKVLTTMITNFCSTYFQNNLVEITPTEQLLKQIIEIFKALNTCAASNAELLITLKTLSSHSLNPDSRKFLELEKFIKFHLINASDCLNKTQALAKQMNEFIQKNHEDALNNLMPEQRNSLSNIELQKLANEQAEKLESLDKILEPFYATLKIIPTSIEQNGFIDISCRPGLRNF